MAGNEYDKPRDYIRMGGTWMGKGWDFSALALDRPELKLSPEERDRLFLREQFARAAFALRASASHEEASDIIDYVVIKAFFDAGGDASSLTTLSCLDGVEDLVDGMTLFLNHGGYFEVITGEDISTIRIAPHEYDWVRFGEGDYKNGFYDEGTKDIIWSVHHQFPCKNMDYFVFPVHCFDENKIYRIL